MWLTKLRSQTKYTRHAAISIYDGKEHKNLSSKDTPCTYASTIYNTT